MAEKDYIFPMPETKIFPGQKIIIRRAVPVAIEVDQQKIKLDTLGTTVRDAIIEADITLSHADKVSPGCQFDPHSQPRHKNNENKF